MHLDDKEQSVFSVQKELTFLSQWLCLSHMLLCWNNGPKSFFVSALEFSLIGFFGLSLYLVVGRSCECSIPAFFLRIIWPWLVSSSIKQTLSKRIHRFFARQLKELNRQRDRPPEEAI
jgi:hypothetical protein